MPFAKEETNGWKGMKRKALWKAFPHKRQRSKRGRSGKKVMWRKKEKCQQDLGWEIRIAISTRIGGAGTKKKKFG